MPVKRAFAVASLTAVLASGSLSVANGSALAFLSSVSDPAVNDFSVGLNTVEVDEEFDPVPDEDGRVTKTVRARNTGDCPCYVRALVLPGLSSDFSSVEWCDGPWGEPDSDGYRCYGEVLMPGAVTKPLMTGVHVADGALDRSGGDPQVLVYMESVQAEGFEDASQAFSALAGEAL